MAVTRSQKLANYNRTLKSKIRNTSHNFSRNPSLIPSMRHINRDGAKSYETLGNWVTTPLTTISANAQRETISDRAWDLYINDAAAHGIIENYGVDIAGTGLTPIPQPMTEYLGFDSAWEDEFEEACRNDWKIWGLDPFKSCDAARRMNINEMMLWAIFSWKLEGIALFLPLMLPETPYRTFSLCLQQIAAHRLKTPTDLYYRDDVFDGVEVDSNGAAKAFWIQNYSAESYSANSTSSNFKRIEAYNSKTGRPNIIACYSVRNVTDYRSEGSLTAIIKTLRDRHDHVDAALVGAMVANLFTIFIKNGLTLKDQDGNTISEPYEEISGGAILRGAAGEEPSVIKQDRPGPHFEAMNNATVEELGMASGQGFEKVIKKWISSYSASRASILQAMKVNDVDRETLIGFCNIARILQMEESALRGRIPIKNIEHFYKNILPYCQCRWLAPAVGDVDPVKAAEADAKAMENGDKTLADICAEKGQHWKDKIKERFKIELYVELYKQNLEKKYGVKLSKPAPAPTKPNQKPDNKNKNDNKGDQEDEQNKDDPYNPDEDQE